MRTPRSGLILFVPVLALALFGAVPSISQARETGTTLVRSFPGRMVEVRAGQNDIRQPQVRADGVFSGAAASAPATADIQVTYHGFSTAARTAFQAAAAEWEHHVVSSQVIHIDAWWTPLGSGVLGAAGPANFYLLDDGYVYPAALAEALCGCESDASVEIQAYFNSDFGQWYLGTDGRTPWYLWDFNTVVLHELGHGLGFLSSFSVSGSSGGWGFTDGTNTYPMRYDINEWSAETGGRQLTDTAFVANPSTSLRAELTDGTVYFGGSNVVTLLGGRAKLYAPNPWQGGSSNSHFDEDAYPAWTPNSLMTPVLNNGEVQHEPGSLALAVLRDVGWQEAPWVAVSVGDVAVVEGEAASFTFTLSEPVNEIVTVHFTTQDVTAVAPADYQHVDGAIEFQPYETTQVFVIATVDDVIDEPDETFALNLSDPVNATIADSQAIATITDNDGISITDEQFDESVGSAEFTVSLSGPMDQTVTVDYHTTDETAMAPADYAATSGTLTFSPGTTTQPVMVPIVEDQIFDGDETFGVELSNPTNLTINKGWGGATIYDDDVPATPSLIIRDSGVAEGVYATVTVILAPVSDETVVVYGATADGTATAPGDYSGGGHRFTFQPGESRLEWYIEVGWDGMDEADETFSVILSEATNAAIYDAQGTVTIHDRDPAPSLSIGDVSVSEGAGNAAFTVGLSAPSSQVVTVDCATTNGTAAAPADYAAWSGPLTFSPGQTAKTVSIPIVNDTADEPNETFTMTLSSPVNATLDDAQATGTIVDNDAPPPPAGATISIADASVREGNQRYYTVNLVFKVTLSKKVTGPVTVHFVTANGTAVAGSDYIAKSGLLTWTKRQIKNGKLTKSLIIKVKCDRLFEANETLLLILSGPTNAKLGDSQATGTIINDD